MGAFGEAEQDMRRGRVLCPRFLKTPGHPNQWLAVTPKEWMGKKGSFTHPFLGPSLKRVIPLTHPFYMEIPVSRGSGWIRHDSGGTLMSMNGRLASWLG